MIAKILALLLFACAAHSQVTTYLYTGQPMATAGNLITGRVVLAAPLAANGTQSVVPVSYSFTGDLPIATQNASVLDGYPVPTFSFTTQNGLIVAWDIELPFLATGPTTATISVTNSGDSYSMVLYDGGCQPSPNCQRLDESNTAAGTWSVPQGAYAVSQGTLAWWTARAWTLSAQYDGEVADVTYLDKLLNQVQSQRDANWNRLMYLNTLSNQLQTQVAQCRANKGVC